MKRRKKSVQKILMIILIIVLGSCITVTKNVPVPDPVSVLSDSIVWPAFPDPEGIVTYQDGVVSMPLDFWLEITDYVIDVDNIIDDIEAAKAARGEK